MAMKVIPAAQAELLKKINSVEGFDPEAFTTEYTDMNSGDQKASACHGADGLVPSEVPGG